jgi:formamidopyrimidine-DNA glycosylase
MPELPEVETTRRGLAAHLTGRCVVAVRLHRPDLRWPFPPELQTALPGQRLNAVTRRAKYLLLDSRAGSVLAHLGMSGSLRLVAADSPRRAHDHAELVLDSGLALRLHDPRRFGCLLWQAPGTLHPLLAGLGPEPLSDAFDGAWLHRLAVGRRASVKTFLMDQRVVVGVGNIYAAEALFAAGIHPLRAAGRVSRPRFEALADAVKRTLDAAITRGGTTLRDFLDPDGSPGYFAQELQVYGREGAPCRRCGARLRGALIGQRASVWCPRCQR